MLLDWFLAGSGGVETPECGYRLFMAVRTLGGLHEDDIGLYALAFPQIRNVRIPDLQIRSIAIASTSRVVEKAVFLEINHHACLGADQRFSATWKMIVRSVGLRTLGVW